MASRIRKCFRLISLYFSYKLYNVKYNEDFDRILQFFCDDLLIPSIDYFSDGRPYRIIFNKGHGKSTKLFAFNLTEPLLTRCTMQTVNYVDKDGKISFNMGEEVSGVRASYKTIFQFLDIFEKRYTSEDYNRGILLEKIRKELPLYEELKDA